MNLQGMFDRVLLESGQFLMKEDIEVDLDRFRVLVEMALGVYNQYAPHSEKFNLDSQGLEYKFTENGKGGIPDWISDIVPVRLAGVHPFYFRQKEEWVNKELEYKRQFPWEYIKPILYVPVQSVYEITAVYYHKVTETTFEDPASGTLRKNLEVTTIDHSDDDFFELLTGYFLKTIGRNRRAFTVNDLPISVDAADLVSEGQAMEESAKQDMMDKSSKFYLAWR